MDNELLLLLKKHAITFFEQIKPKPQETLEFKMNKQVKTVSFTREINLVEEGKCLLSLRKVEATNSVFNKTGENRGLSFTTPGH